MSKTFEIVYLSHKYTTFLNIHANYCVKLKLILIPKLDFDIG